MLKQLLSFLCLCSLSCTCLVTNTLAQATGGDDMPCHHMETMDMGADEQPKDKNCCTEKMEAWREAVQQDDGTDLTETPVAIQALSYSVVLCPELTPYKPYVISSGSRPPAHIYSWKTIRLIL